MRYPIYIPSKGRADRPLTFQLLRDADLYPFVVVEPQDFAEYVDQLGSGSVLRIPENDQGIAFARNWIKEHAIQLGVKRHWALDDNIRHIKMFTKGDRINVNPGVALSHIEQLVDRYTNVAIAGLMSAAFGHEITEPFSTNKQVYCAVLVQSDDFRWRSLEGGEDTDYSLQVLTSKLCTILIKFYQIEKLITGSVSGGNTEMYLEDDARLRRARALQRQWPGLVKVTRRWGRPGQDLSHVWRKFDQPLIPKDDT